MPFEPDRLLALPPRVTHHRYTQRDTILYALGVGAGQDPARDDLRFVYEEGLQALPTMAVVLAYPGFWQREAGYAIDWRRVLHAEQSVTFHAPMPVAGEVRGELTIERIVDKGAAKGALLYSLRRIFDVTDDTLLASVRQVSFLRGDGGRGGNAEAGPPPHAVPTRVPDSVLTLTTRPEQAMLYRLSGDFNPLHVDPAAAGAAGLPRPILHGLCSYGVAGRAILAALCDDDPARLARLDCRFTAPVFPGETFELRIWRQADGHGAFQAWIPARDALVLNNGFAEIRNR